MNLEDALVSVWRQTLVEQAESVELGGQSFPVKRTPRRALRQVDFTFAGEPVRGLEQNPQTQSHWAQMARRGVRIMQFLPGGRYIANVAGGKLTLYGRPAASRRRRRPRPE